MTAILRTWPFSHLAVVNVAEFPGGSCRRQSADSEQPPVTASLTDLTKFCESRLGDFKLGPEVLTRQFGLSRATLYRLFEPHGGVSVYILERRLDRALRATTSPQSRHARLKQLAHDLGFAHQSSFTRAFKKRFGVTRQDVRSLRSHPDEIGTTAGLNALRSFALSTDRVKPDAMSDRSIDV